MKIIKTYYLIDYENVGSEGFKGCEKLRETDIIHLFYTDNSRKIDLDIIGASTLARNKNYYKPQKCGLFYVKFYLFLCCTELYFIFICDIMRYETQL